MTSRNISRQPHARSLRDSPHNSPDTNNDVGGTSSISSRSASSSPTRSRSQSNHTSLVRDGQKPKAKVRPTPRNGIYRKADQVEKPSVRKRFYEKLEMDDYLQDKIATQLRENGITEIRVPALSAKISQAVRDDVMDSNSRQQPEVMTNLCETVSDHLDAILYNKPQHTDLASIRQQKDILQLSNMVLARTAQVHEELEMCKQRVEESQQGMAQGTAGIDGSSTPRGTRDQPERSVVLIIKEGIEKQKTDKEILEDRLGQAARDNNDVEGKRVQTQQEAQDLDAQNWQLSKDLQEAVQEKEQLNENLKQQKVEQRKLEKLIQANNHEIQMLKTQLTEMDSQSNKMAKDLSILMSEKAKLQVLCDQRQKEILHLRHPDRDLVLQLKALRLEVTTLRTETRRLGEAKGLFKARGQKLEAELVESQLQRNKLTVERDGLVKENQNLKQRYRKLTLATPAQRTLPDIITTPRKAPRANTRVASRAANRDSSNSLLDRVKSEAGLSPHQEETLENNLGVQL